MTEQPQPVELDEVQPGDRADHWSGDLDPRSVTRVDHEKKKVWLQFPGSEMGPFDRDNYTYKRPPTA